MCVSFYTPQFKLQVVLETIKELSTLGELADKYNLSTSLIEEWKVQFLENAESFFEKRNSEISLIDKLKKRADDQKIRLNKLSKEAIDYLLKGDFKESFVCIVETAPVTGRNELTRLFCVNKELIIKSLSNINLNCTAEEIDFIRSILYFSIGDNEKALFFMREFYAEKNLDSYQKYNNYKRGKLVECLILLELGKKEESNELATNIQSMVYATISSSPSPKVKHGA